MKTLVILALSFSFKFASAHDLKNPECVGPLQAPVVAIYLHGFDMNLEKGHRDRLTAFANRQNIRIAIPVARGTNKKGKREWAMGSLKDSLKAIEFQAATVCDGPLAKPRALIGFGEGGIWARELALDCSSLTRDYSAIIMSGVQPRTPDFGMKKCTKLVAARGQRDDSTDICHNEINKKKKKMMKICIPFKVAVEKMRTRYPDVETEIFPGKRSLPPDDVLIKYLPIPQPEE